MQQSPLLSFIVPIYNSEKYLKQCVDSLLKNKTEKIQVILVNDGSIDTSGDIADQYAQADSRVLVVHKKNGGVASARSSGIEAAQGTYLFFIDNDDWIDSEKISNLLQIIESKKVDIIFNRYMIVYEKGSSVLGNGFIDPQYIENRSTEEVLSYFKTNRINIMAPWEYVIRKEIIVRNGLTFDSNQSGVDDSSFSPILYCHCESFYLNTDIVYYWRQRSDSQGKSHDWHIFIPKLISTLGTLETYLKNEGVVYKKEYILFSIYKNIYTLVGQYYNYDNSDRGLVDRWCYERRLLIKEAVRQSGFTHRVLYAIFGGFFGILLSYRLAVFKGFAYSYIYGHITRIKK